MQDGEREEALAERGEITSQREPQMPHKIRAAKGQQIIEMCVI